MSTASEHGGGVDVSSGSWRAGVVGGIGGGVAMGALIAAMSVGTIAVAIPSLYTLAPPANPGLGLLVHVSHGAVLGVVFAGIVGALGVASTRQLVGLGLAWGILTWAVLAALLMPAWLNVVGSPASPPLPNFALPSLLWHAVYGLVLGGVYAATVDRL